MKKLTLTLAVFFAILFFAIYWFCLSPNKSNQQLNLWYVSSDFSPEIMEELADRYNQQRAADDFKLVLRSFDTEDDLAAAYGNSYPDLLLCSYTRAAGLGQREQLKSLNGISISYLAEIKEAIPYAGISFFPLGSAIPVLVYNSKLISQPSERLSEFYEQAQEYYLATSSPFFTCEEVLPMLNSWSVSLGYELLGDLTLDNSSSVFCSVYNSMAQQVMNGSFLPPTKDALSLVSQGLIPCAIVPSFRAVDLSKNLELMAIPSYEDGDGVYVADIMGIAVTNANSYASHSCKAFALWLKKYFSTMDALNLGLVPALTDAQGQSYSDLDTVLLNVYTGSPKVYSATGSYMQNREEMESKICHALDLLY